MWLPTIECRVYVAPQDFEWVVQRPRRRWRLSDATRIFQIRRHGAEIELSKGAHHHCPGPLGHRLSRFDLELLNPGSYRGEPHNNLLNYCNYLRAYEY